MPPFHTQQPSETNRAGAISKAFARSVRDNTIAEFAAQMIRFGGLIVLARALTPEDFGIFKALFAITAIVSMFIEGGIPDALVQRRDITREHECTGWWLSFGISTLSVTAVFFAASLIASLMEMPMLKPGIRLMCIPLLLDGTSQVSSARLQRELRFSALALADVLAEVAFLAAALALIAVGEVQLSLIGALCARVVAHGLTIWIADAYVPRGLPRVAAVNDLGGFALSVWGGRIIQAAAANVDYLLIGRVLGSGPLGLYGIARDLLKFIPNRLHKVAGRVAFPAFAKLQDDHLELSRSYAQFFNSLSRIVFPIVACMAVTAPDLIRTIYGYKWIAAAEPLQLLAIGLAFAGVNVGVSAVYYARGRPGFDMYLSAMRLTLIVASILLLSGEGLIGVTAAIGAAELANAFATQLVGSWFTELSLKDILREAMPAIRVAVICAIVAGLADWVAHYFAFRGALALIIAATPAALVYLKLEGSNLLGMVRASMGKRKPSRARERFSGAQS